MRKKDIYYIARMLFLSKPDKNLPDSTSQWHLTVNTFVNNLKQTQNNFNEDKFLEICLRG